MKHFPAEELLFSSSALWLYSCITMKDVLLHLVSFKVL